MKSVKTFVALLVAVLFVFAAAAYAQEAAAEKAAEKVDAKDVQEATAAAKAEATEGAPMSDEAAAKLAAESKEDKAEVKAADETEKKDMAEPKEAAAEGAPVDAEKMAAEQAEVKKDIESEKAAEKLQISEDRAEKVEKKDVVETAMATASLKTLVSSLRTAGLVETLKDKGPFTVFAPNDAAFAKIPKAELDALLADKAKLAGVLKMHVVAGKVMAADVAKMKEVKTLNGNVKITVKDDVVMFGGAKVGKTDIECANGIIHVIDTVVMTK